MITWRRRGKYKTAHAWANGDRPLCNARVHDRPPRVVALHEDGTPFFSVCAYCLTSVRAGRVPTPEPLWKRALLARGSLTLSPVLRIVS